MEFQASHINAPALAQQPPAPRWNNNMGEERTAGRTTRGTAPAEGGFGSYLAENFGQDKAEGGSGNKVMDFIFGLIDVINPLQHIPGVSTLYRNITGDEIGPMARMVGDTLYGGPVGAALAVANIAAEKSTGRDIGENMVAMFKGDDAAPAGQPPVMLAQNMNNIAPAAGGRAASDIQWFDNGGSAAADLAPQNVTNEIRLSSIPTPHSTGTDGVKPVAHSTSYTPPVSSNGGTMQARSRLTAAAPDLASSPSHDAPVADPRTGDAPEQIAAAGGETAGPAQVLVTRPRGEIMERGDIARKMAEALDKYGAMKRNGL